MSWLVRSQAALPQRAISRLVGALARSRLRPLKNLLIGAFIRLYEVDMQEAAEPDPYAYPTFNAFFTRSLAAGARPDAAPPTAIVSPADGTISQCGAIEDRTLVQAKGRHYSLDALLAGGEPAHFVGGRFVTIYLAPHDYHRVHTPLDATLLGHRYVPGRLFSVNDATARAIDGIFSRNERVVFDFDSAAGPVAVIMVAALNVGNIESVHAGVIAPARPGAAGPVLYESPQRLQRGDELARFNLGSTVILLFAPGRVELDPALAPGRRVRVGEPIAQSIEAI